MERPRSGWGADRRSRHARGYGTRWDKLRAAVMARDLYLCQVCQAQGRVTPATEVDHIVNKARGGTDELANLQAICRACHVEKTEGERRASLGGKSRRAVGLDGWPIS